MSDDNLKVTPRKYAVIADVHGNSIALEAVLRDIQNRDVVSIINLGDSLYGPLDPSGTADMLMNPAIRSIRGNEDRVIFSSDVGEPCSTLRYVRTVIKAEHLTWLRAMPPAALIDGAFYACHGSPRSDTEYLFWDVSSNGTVLRREEEMAEMVRGMDAPVILCGHDHVPHSIRLPDGTLIVNPGSVGLPAYEDDTPFHHVMQNDSPHARYALVIEEHGRWEIEHRRVIYDWDAAAVMAESNGRRDWAHWLRTGKVNTD